MKLAGLKVLDLSSFLPGPHMSMMMADHGADVIMIEVANGRGEPARDIGYRADDGVSVWFRNIGRGKEAVALNLKEAGDLAYFRSLAREADVVVEAFRPGVVERLGIGPAALRAENPGLVYCSISAFGQDGPLRDRPAHDLAVQALAGTTDLNRGLEDDKPAMPNIPAADMCASLMAFSGILMALYRRRSTGQGDVLDISMHDCLLSWTANVTGPVFAEDRAPEPKTMRSFGGAGMYNIYETSDGKFIVLGGSEPKFARVLLDAFERPDLYSYATIEPGPEQAPLRAFFKNSFAAKSLDHWMAFLGNLDICWAPVLTLKEAFEHPHVKARSMLLHDSDKQTHLGVPIKFAGEPAMPNLSLPPYREAASGHRPRFSGGNEQ